MVLLDICYILTSNSSFENTVVFSSWVQFLFLNSDSISMIGRVSSDQVYLSSEVLKVWVRYNC